jgi:two-component system, sensor histidine kinase
VKGELILILAPVGRDGPLAQKALSTAGLPARVCSTVDELCAALPDAGAAILTEEALHPAAEARLSRALAAQPAWSDFPLVVFGSRDTALSRGANLTLLDRPVRIRSLVSAVQTALRARRRQYEVRNLLAALEQSVRDRDQFLAMLGHELRNPLSAVLTASELIDGKAAGSFATERGVVRRQLRHLGRLVDDLLDVSRVTRGKIVLNSENVDLRSLISRSVAHFAQSAPRQGVALTCALGDEHIIVRGDPLRLQRVIDNLLSNAVKYTNALGRVEVRAAAREGSAVIEVEDSGIGISPEMLPRVFEMFTQAAGAIDRSQGGMGIGLTLVQRLIALHGGSVEAHSGGLGKGSLFRVRLPLAAELAPEPRETAVAQARRPQLRLLIAEDNADARELLQLALEQLGHRVEPCADGTSAITRALSNKPDAMLIDLGLPGSDGFEVARTVRAALGHRVRLVALTGYGQPSDRERALAAGFNEFLVKPAEIETVARALEAAQ